jgi:hypothetical protein
MKFFSFIAFCFFVFNSAAVTVSGRVTDKSKNPISFASVFLKGTSIGTTTNVDGFYSLDLKPGNYELVFRYISYKMHVEQLKIGSENIQLNIVLEDEKLTLQEVVVRADAEDPAYAVIRHAIKKRKHYLNQVNAFSCDVYIKGIQKLTKFPNKIMGVKINGEGQIDTVSGIIYLSESVSKFSFQKPDKIREEMISSKVSGNNNAFSYNQASDMLFNFYENLLQVEALGGRGFISPISNNALLSYRYKLLGTFFENDQMINKIEVIPIRKFDPVFRGIIYIAENTWRIHSVDLFLTKDAQIVFVDTLHINQVHLPVKDDIWMPFSNKFTFNFGFFGIKGNGMFIGVNSNYIIDPVFPDKYFTSEVLKVVEGANEKDSTYWKAMRPVPLTPEEKTDYRKKDSLEIIHSSKPYRDSIDRKHNKFKAANLLFGYSYHQSFKKRYFSITPLIENVAFNTVQGLNAGIGVAFSKEFPEKHKELNLGSDFNYGFADQKTHGTFSFRYSYKPERFAVIGFNFGRDYTQINTQRPISKLVNTIYTLLAEENHMKLFENNFLAVNNRYEISNGVMIRGRIEYADRIPLLNHSTYTLVNDPEKKYTSNNPLDPKNNTYAFARNQSFNFSVDLRLRYKQQYYTKPGEKVISGSKFPALNIYYKKAIGEVFKSDADYDFLKLYVIDRINLKLLGKTRYEVAIGKFLSSRNVPLTDYHHFLGNQTLYSPFELTRYNLLPYYAFSTKNEFIEVHAEHNFGGFILNKFPLIRRLKLHEIAGFHYLSSNTLPQYFEFSIGLERLVARIDFVTSYSHNTKLSSGLRFGFSF